MNYEMNQIDTDTNDIKIILVFLVITIMHN